VPLWSELNVLSEVELPLHVLPMNVLLIAASGYFEFAVVTHVVLQLYVQVCFVFENFCYLVALHCPAQDQLAVFVHCLFINLEN
jgi:hypothetical protein